MTPNSLVDVLRERYRYVSIVYPITILIEHHTGIVTGVKLMPIETNFQKKCEELRAKWK